MARASPAPTPPPKDLLQEYAKGITDESRRAIRRLAFWARKKGPMFYLIGGWAAWRFHQGLGSRDIDVGFPNQTILEQFMTQYYHENGYVKTGGALDPGWQKLVETPQGRQFIEVDAAQLDAGLPFHEDEKIDLPYRLLEDHHQICTLDGEEVPIPTAELLLLQKVKAHRDRSWDLASMPEPDQDYEGTFEAFKSLLPRVGARDLLRAASGMKSHAALARLGHFLGRASGDPSMFREVSAVLAELERSLARAGPIYLGTRPNLPGNRYDRRFKVVYPGDA